MPTPSSLARPRRALLPLLGALALGAVLAALPALAVAAHAQDRPATERPARDRAALQTERLARQLDLTDAQRTELDRLAARYRDAGAEPGALWRMAAEVDALLTPAQRAALDARRTERQARPDGAERTERRPRGDRAERPRGERSRGERRNGAGRAGAGGFEGAVSPENRDAARAVAARYRTQMEALRADFNAERIGRPDFTARMRTLREEMRVELAPLMSAEARARMTETSAARERADAVRAEVLGLAPEQRADVGDRGNAALTAEQARLAAIHRALTGGREGAGRGMRGRMERGDGERPARGRRSPGH